MPDRFGARFGLIKAPLSLVAGELHDWRKELGFGPRVVDLPGGLSENAVHLLPLEVAPAVRDLLVATPGDTWTAYFDQYPSGDVVGPTGVLQSRLNVSGVIVTAVPFPGEPGAIPDSPGGLMFFYSPDGSIGSDRSVALVKGEYSPSRYHFEQFGAVQPWEEPEHYTARRKRDRLTPEMIDRYCRALGIEDVFNPDYYSGPSVFIERTRFEQVDDRHVYLPPWLDSAPSADSDPTGASGVGDPLVRPEGPRVIIVSLDPSWRSSRDP